MNERPPPPYGAPSLEELTGLVFELASQLHIERVRRTSLEVALAEAGILSLQAAEAQATNPLMKSLSAAGLQRSMDGVMRVLTENNDPRKPLRANSDKKTEDSES